MTTLRKAMLFITFNPRNLELFANSILESEECEAGLSRNFIRHTEHDAERMGLFDPYKELFLRIWASKAYELNGNHHDAAMCYDRAAKVAWVLKLNDYRANFLQHCYQCHLKTDKPTKFEDASYALLKSASSMKGSRVEKLRMISLAELGFVCAGLDLGQMPLAIKILKDVRHFSINDLLHDLLAKRISIKSDDERELFIRDILFSAEELRHGFYTQLRTIPEEKGINQALKTMASTFLGRHYETVRENISAGNNYQNAVTNNINFLPRINMALLLRTAVSYIREGAYNPAVNALHKMQPLVSQTAPEFAEAFSDRIKSINKNTIK